MPTEVICPLASEKTITPAMTTAGVASAVSIAPFGVPITPLRVDPQRAVESGTAIVQAFVIVDPPRGFGSDETPAGSAMEMEVGHGSPSTLVSPLSNFWNGELESS